MNTVTADFHSITGEHFRVYIGSGGFPAGKSITLAGESPVKISFAQGESKFCGLRTVTATIRLVANEDMSWMYATGATTIRVAIVKISSNGNESEVFGGYLVPFTFDMPYLLCNDIIELTAVDLISANKYNIYTGKNFIASRANGNKMSALTWICSMLQLCGSIDTIIYVHENFGPAKTFKHNIETVMISPQAFLPSDWYHDKPTLSYADIISYIAQYFGYTAMYINGALYMYDTNALSNMSVWYKTTKYQQTTDGNLYTRVQDYSIQNSLVTPFCQHKTVYATDFERADAKMTIEQSYDYAQITPRDTGKQIYIPDILQSDNESDEQWKSGGSMGTWDEWIFTALTRADIDCYAYDLNGYIKDSIDIIDDNDLQWSGIIPINVSYCNVKQYNGVRNQKMLWYHRYPLASGKSITRPNIAILPDDNVPYYDGRKFRVAMSAMYSIYNATSNARSWLPPFDEIGRSKSGVGPYAFPNLYIYTEDNMSPAYYYQSDGAAADEIKTMWNLAENTAPMKMGDANTHGELALLNTRNAVNWRQSGWLGQGPEGPLRIEISPDSMSSSDTRYDAWIMGLSMECAERDYNVEDTKIQLHYGTSEETISISCGLVSNYGHNMHSMVLANLWSGTYMGTADADAEMEHCGVLSNQVASRYGYIHKAYHLTLGSDILPWSVLNFQGNKYTVDAMEWDLSEGTKSITIN